MADLYPFKSSHSLSVSTRQALMTMLTTGLLALLALTLPQKAWADGPIYVDRDAQVSSPGSGCGILIIIK